MTIEPHEFMRAIKAKNAISAADTLALHKVMWPDGCISEAEADILFELNNIGGMMSTEWGTLFVQGVANHLMAHDDFQPLMRGDAVQLEAFMDDNQPSVGSFFGRMAKSDISRAFGDIFRRKEAGPTHDEKVAEDLAMTRQESDWLQARIDADQKIDALEKRLLKFIAEESA